MKRLLSLIALLLIGGLGIALASHHSRPAAKEVNITKACTKMACIQLKTADNTIYELDDFRFAPNHCINFISLPDNTSRHYCGTYHLKWIGPDNTKSTQGV